MSFTSSNYTIGRADESGHSNGGFGSADQVAAQADKVADAALAEERVMRQAHVAGPEPCENLQVVFLRRIA